MSDKEEVQLEPVRKKKGQNIKGVENKRKKALENLKAGRERRQALLKAKREAEKEGNEYSLDDSSSSDSDEEVDVKDFVLSKKKQKGKGKKEIHDDVKDDIARLKEAVLELSKKNKQKKRRSTKLVMLPPQNTPQQAPKTRIEDSRYDAIRRMIMGH